MRISNVNNTVNFGMKIVKNDELKDLISNLQRQRGYSQKKIEGIMDSIKKMADDSYNFEVESINPYSGMVCYSVYTDNEDAAIDSRGDICSTLRFFMLHSINKVCKNLVKQNKKAGSAREIYDYAVKNGENN